MHRKLEQSGKNTEASCDGAGWGKPESPSNGRLPGCYIAERIGAIAYLSNSKCQTRRKGRDQRDCGRVGRTHDRQACWGVLGDDAGCNVVSVGPPEYPADGALATHGHVGIPIGSGRVDVRSTHGLDAVAIFAVTKGTCAVDDHVVVLNQSRLTDDEFVQVARRGACLRSD